MIATHLTAIFYVLTAVGGASGAVLLFAAANKAALPLRPWFAAAIPAALGYVLVTAARLTEIDDDRLTDVARGISLYGIAVLYNALPYAALRTGRLTPVALDEFVAEVSRQLTDTGEIPLTPKDEGGDGVVV